MSNPTDTTNDAAAEDSQGPVGGERLAEARREQQISVVEVAKELHLDEPKVRALERNEFEMLGAPVFAKGHLKKYAHLVGVDEADVLADYHQLTRSSIVPPVVTARRRPRRELAPGPWVAAIVIIILVATAYWWFTSRPLSVPAPAEESVPVPEEESPESTAEAMDPVVLDDVEVVDDTRALEPDAGDIIAPDEAREPVAGELQLRIVFSGDCWTEITDAGGQRLFFGLGREGRTVDLSGEPPFNVLFGNAENVSLEVNGADYDLATADRRGRTARLTISGT